MAIIFKNDSLAKGIEGAGTVLGEALKKRGELQQKQEIQGSLANVLSEVDMEDPMRIQQAIAEANRLNAPSSTLDFLNKSYQSARKSSAFKSALDIAMEQEGGIESEKGKSAFLKEFTSRGGDPFEAMKMFKETKGTSAFGKEMDKFMAKSTIAYIQGAPQKQKNLKENLDWLQDNIENVGMGQAYTPFTKGSYGIPQRFLPGEIFTEYANRGELILTGVIELFNPAGVLPDAKLRRLRERFAVNPNDTQAQIQGKINALRTLEQAGSSYVDIMGDLIDQYGENIPRGEFMKAMSVLQKSLDEVDQIYEKQLKPSQEASDKGYSPGQEYTVARMPAASSVPKGTEYEDDNGVLYINNGKKWIKKK